MAVRNITERAATLDKKIGIFEIPMLQITGGFARKTAIDLETEANFIEYNIDYQAGETPEECAVPECEVLVCHGWHCLDGGEMYCEDHVVIVDDLTEERVNGTSDHTDESEPEEAKPQF